MKSLGIISITFLLLALVFMLLKWPASKSLTLSGNAARSKVSAIYYGVVSIISLAGFSFFTLGWLARELHFPMSFYIIFIIGVIGEAVAAIVPETRGLSEKIHKIFASIMHWLLPVLVFYFVFDRSLTLITRGLAALTLVFMITLVFLSVFYKKTYQHSLLLQSLYLISFFAVFMAATYIG